MKSFQFITNEMVSGEYLRYQILAVSFQEACWKMSCMGLLKGHMLRNFSGKWIPVKTCFEEMMYSFREENLGRFIIEYAENYWQPDYIQAFCQENGLYTIKFVSRDRKTVSITRDLTRYSALKRLRAYCVFNKVEFLGFH